MTASTGRDRTSVQALWAVEPVRFAGVGAVNTLLGYAAFLGLLALLGPDRYLLALVVTYALAGQVAFALHRRVTFRRSGRQHLLADLGRYWSVNAGVVLGNAVLLPVLVEVLGLDRPAVAQAVALVVLTVASYLLHARVSFRRPAAPVPVRAGQEPGHDPAEVRAWR